jgi:peptidoglycan/LPS O-acetylase OafA/YrhL
MQERLRRAFSIRRNLRLLFTPVEGHLRPLDGLRALSILWVVVFHAAWYGALHIPPPVYGGLLLSPLMLPVWRGDFGVDVFFVLSGFLIAGMLIDERTKTGGLRLGLFYGRRLMRLWPALVVAVVVDMAVIGDNREATWANLLYLSNFLPIRESAMAWTWSLAIEEQFYLLCPWLVNGLAPMAPSRRVATLAAIAVALCALGAWIVVAGGFHHFDTEIVVNRDPDRWALGFDTLYTKPWMRAGPLLAGVASAYVYRAPRAMQAIATGGWKTVVGLVAALVVGAACTHWQLVWGAPRVVEVAYVALFRTAFGVSVAFVLLLSVSSHPLGGRLGRLLSARFLYPIAQLAYSAYLLNPIVTGVVDRALAPFVWRDGVAPMPLFLPFDAIGTFVAAAAMYVLVERPFMELRPR